jgi:GT2 family glycosyltransferase
MTNSGKHKSKLMKVTIVATYHNRRSQLLNTLATIKHYGHDPEIIIVDDGSSERIDDIKGIKLVRIEAKDKWYHNPCIPYNIGFSLVKSDIVIIQNPECCYCGDIVGYVLKNIKKNDWLSFGAYSLDTDLKFTEDQIPLLKSWILKHPQREQSNHYGWYNHSLFRPAGYHFCAAIMRSDLEELGGFDERYASGIACDDDDLILRIKRKGMNFKLVDDPFVIHQKHERTDYAKYAKERALNHVVYFRALREEKFIKAPQNKYYGVL